MSTTPLADYFVHCHNVRGLRVAFTVPELDLPKHTICYLVIRGAQHLVQVKIKTHGLWLHHFAQSVAVLANRNTVGGLIEKQSIQAMAVGTGSKTAAEGSYKMRMYIAALSQSHPIALKPKTKLT